MRTTICGLCGSENLWLGRFCRHCGKSLRTPWVGVTARPQLQPLWIQSASTDLDWPLVLDAPLLATPGQQGSVQLWDTESGQPLARTQTLEGLQLACLMDSLLLAICRDRLEVIHLTPLLTGDACRFNRNSKLALDGPLRSPIACFGQKAAWISGPNLLAVEARPQGLLEIWRRPAPSEICALLWNEQGLWALQKQLLLWLDPQDGRLIQEWQLPFVALDLKAVGPWLLIGGERGELFKIFDNQGHWLRPGDDKTCFALAASPQMAAFSRGRSVLFVDFVTARSRTLELPQACVLPLILSQQWALVTSSEGMLYEIDLQGGLARIRGAHRPFTSFEPTTTAPVITGNKVLLAGPDGQLAAWALSQQDQNRSARYRDDRLHRYGWV